MMFHFAYPNKGRGKEFIGCGRYVALSYENMPEQGYKPAKPDSKNISKITTAASLLVPDSSDTGKGIYEIKDTPDEVYRGDSQDLAYLLALISRSKSVRSDIPNDIWCTGSIDIKDGKSPFLDAVTPSGFDVKLNAFLSPENPDNLFIVPVSNIQPDHEILFREKNINMVSLAQFREQRLTLHHLCERKTVLTVHGHELNLLTDLIFLSDAENMSDNGLRVALVYKRRAQPDEHLLTLLEKHLTEAGHRVFIDRHMKIGDEWEKQISYELTNADAVVILLSPMSVYSEMLAYEVDIAYKTALERGGKPKLFPVRINFEDPLPQELANKLAPLQYALWRDTDDDMPLVCELLDRLPHPPVPLEMIGGAVPLDSKFYVVRQVDEDFQSALSRRDAVVLLKGGRQVGKTSLLARGLQNARDAGAEVVLTDFQRFIDSQLQTLESFFFAVGEMLADQLGADVYPRDTWKADRAPNINFENYFRQHILGNTQKPLLWAMDEADRLFHCSFGTEVFAMFRTWHNERAFNPGGPCSRLTLAIAYATEAYLFIKDLNQSPFNVGTKLVLEDFTFDQTADLNRRYGSPLRDEQLRRFYQMVGGQPYLVRRGLNEIVSQNLSFDEFAASADNDDGAFGDHLRRILVLLNREPLLSQVVRDVVWGGPCSDYDTFYRLRSSGILSGSSKDDVGPRCELYEAYLKKHLNKAEKKSGFWKKLFSFGKGKNE